MQTTYFIKLRPLNSFYFGSIKNFGSENKDYFLKSNYYPQQTAILGMLSKKLLEDNNCLVPFELRDDEQRNREKKIIGELKSSIENSKFGAIETMSSVQIFDEDGKYLYMYPVIGFEDDEVVTNKGKKYLSKYNPKEFEGYFMHKSRGKVNGDEIFISETNIGINRTKDEDGFFKKERFRFINNNYYYGFSVTLNGDINLKDGIVQVGDKYSLFSFEIIREDTRFNDEIIIEKYLNTQDELLFFKSDAYITNEDLETILKKSKGAVIQNNKFKFITREKNRFNEQQKIKNLLARGTILLPDSENEILTILEKEIYNNYKKIGMNEIYIIRGER